MSKRLGKGFEAEKSSAKRPKLELPKPPSNPERPPGESDDIWGEDFDQEEIEHLDQVASQACSQACSQDVNVSTVDPSYREPKNIEKYGSSIQPLPSTSAASFNGHRNTNGTTRARDPPTPSPNKLPRFNSGWRPPASQKLAGSEQIRDIDERLPTIDEFKSSLVSKPNLNSTFASQSQANPAESHLQQLTGEIVYLKDKLEKAKQKAEKEKLEKDKEAQEQVNNLEATIKMLTKERENLKTQNDLQALQLGSLMEKCKLLETNAVKFVQPSTSAFNSPKNKVLRAASFGRTSRAESSVQVDLVERVDCTLKTPVYDYPLHDIPATIFDAPLPEKPVVDVKFVEKIGQRNLPILQEEETFRIFENPDLVKPIVTTVDGRQLTTAFFLADVTVLMRQTGVEINSRDSVPIVNKIVTTTRELLLNSTAVLQKIAAAMKNDDVRDMNDLYVSDFYDSRVDYTQTVCDSNVWHRDERGIEARRALGTLSYVARASNYLGEYIAGKSALIAEGDVALQRQMQRYDAWPKRGHEYEMLEMLLEFVTTVGLIRRAHQFPGMICAIAMTLCNVQSRVGFGNRGMKYVGKIVKEIVFSRPLLQCFVPLIEVFICFCGSQMFNSRICPSPTENSAIQLWKGAQYFTLNACVLEVFMTQLIKFHLDEVTTVNVGYAVLTFVDKAFLQNNIDWPNESNVHNCRINLLKFATTILYHCSKIDVETIRKKLTADECPSKSWRKLSDGFWDEIRRKQFYTFRSGIKFVCFLAKHDPDFFVRISDLFDLFPLFMQQIGRIEGFILHENEQEALASITSTINFERPSPREPTRKIAPELFSVKNSLRIKPETSTETENFCSSFNKSRVKSIIRAYKSKLQ